MKYYTGHIGCGNMGGAIAEAVAEQIGGEKMILTDLNADKLNTLSAKYGCITGDTETVVKEADFIFLGVKPQMMKNLLSKISPMLSARKQPYTIVSMAAGISIESLQQMLGYDAPIIRIMPNIPVSVGKGVIFVCNSQNISTETVNKFTEIMSRAGILLSVNEDKIDAGSAVSGCGPAFVAMAIESLADGAVEVGLPRELALECAAHTLIGTAELFLNSKISTSELKDRVCSPGGSTIAGVHILESRGFRDALMSAVTESYKKTLELGKKQ